MDNTKKCPGGKSSSANASASQGKKETTTTAAAATTDSNPSSRLFRSPWSVMVARGKITDRCLWSACKAMTAGILLILVGAGMATLGFYSDHLSTVEETKGNTTIWVKNESKDTHLGSLTYFGPVVMGIGGFTIVAACVMTFEARDTAAKIVPIWFRRTRIHIVSGGSGSTPSGRSSKSSWEKFFTQHRTSEDGGDTRSAITQALVNFSKYLQQSSVDTKKVGAPVVAAHQGMAMRKCPSEPNLPKLLRGSGPGGDNAQESAALLEASTPQPVQRTPYSGGLKTMSRSTKPQLLSVAPEAYRQALSMDCQRSQKLQRQEAQDNQGSGEVSNVPILITDGCSSHMQTLQPQASCATSSSGSMSVDIYLPQGAVTLKVRDDNKDVTKKSPLLAKCSDESRFSQPSDIRSFDEDDFSYPDLLEDNVFCSQDNSSYVEPPQIVLDGLEVDARSEMSNPRSAVSNKEHSSVEEWVTCRYASGDTSAESLEVQTPSESPESSGINTQFSFEYSDMDSPAYSITSVISIPQTSHLSTQQSFSPTDISFRNVSPLQSSFDSSQELQSPAALPNNPKYPSISSIIPQTMDENSLAAIYNQEFQQSLLKDFQNNQESSAKDQNTFALSPVPKQRLHPVTRKPHFSVGDAHPRLKSSAPDTDSPKKHHSLESTDLPSQSVSDTNLGIGKKTLASSRDPLEPPSPRFLSPGFQFNASSTSAQQTPLTFSPRKVRSESLPEGKPRGPASSLKRFPLLRQVALDAFAEEHGGLSPCRSPAQSLDFSFSPDV